MQQKTYLQIGIIVGQVNVAELKINQVIAAYYAAPDGAEKLARDVIDELNLATKLKCISKIAAEEGVVRDEGVEIAFRTWKKVRNIMAHGTPGMSDGKTVLLSRDGTHNVQRLFKEFGQAQDQLIKWLETITKAITSR